MTERKRLIYRLLNHANGLRERLKRHGLSSLSLSLLENIILFLIILASWQIIMENMKIKQIISMEEKTD